MTSVLPDRTTLLADKPPNRIALPPSTMSSAENDSLGHSNPTHVGIRIDPVALVTQECITITSAMRKHARWAQSSVAMILGGGGQSTSPVLQEKDSRTSVLARSASTASKDGRMSTPKIEPIAVKGRTGSLAPDQEDENSSLASRWGLRSKKVRVVKDDPLLSAFARLRRDLADCRDIAKFDAPALLHPFLQVIRSSSTSATITSLAVISITKFLSYNLITTESPRIASAMHLLSAAITHCRFEASDTAADEVVLLRILRLMELMVCRPEGSLLGDESICEMMSTGLSMCCQARLSEVLRRSAEIAMVTMCQIVFGRLAALDVEELPKTPGGLRSRSNTLHSLGGQPADEVQMKIQPTVTDGSVMANGNDLRPSTDGRHSYDEKDGGEVKAEDPQKQPYTNKQSQIDTEDASPYALPSIRELFRVLIDLLDPHNRQHTDPMRIMALRIVDVALEVSGPFIAAQPTLAVLVEDDLCRHLFQLIRTENVVLLNSSLRVAGTLLTTCRKLLKLQQELFLSYLVACLHPKIDIPPEPGIDPSLYEGVPQAPKLTKPVPSPNQPASGRATPVPVQDRRQLGLEGAHRRPEASESMVETIGTLVRMPTFMAELFINYDCEVDRQDLCEDLIGLLSRNAFPDAAKWTTTNVPPLCLDSLLTFIQFMAERVDQTPTPEAMTRIKELEQRRTRKRIIKSGANKFNDNPKSGIAFLVKNGIIENPDDPDQIAQFLKSTQQVSKKELGDFLSKKNNAILLTAFINSFNFDHKRIDEALRELLSTFRLPGESALIERIVETFVQKYLSCNVPEVIRDKDAGFVLTYAIIMLNTDLYNPQAGRGNKRMTVEDFARNLRGCNANEDFPQDYLQDIYDAIKQDEIILPDEHDNKNAFDHAWKTLLMKTHDAGELQLCETNAFDAEMFRATWKPIVATLCYVFMSASDDAVFSRIVVGFDQCAMLAARHNVQPAFDRIIYSLSQISGLATEVPPSTALNTEVQVGKKKIMVSELAVRLGRDFRAQLATVLLFRTLKDHESTVGETWTYIVRILRNLFVNALIKIPAQTSSRLSDFGPIPLQPPSQVIDKDGKLSESGLFSTFTSYLSSYAADDPPEPSEEELENTLSTVDCINACHAEDILARILKLPISQLEKLVTALLSEMPDAPSPVVVVKPDVRPAPVTARMNGHRNVKPGPDYDPGTVFLLELATSLALRDDESIATTGEHVTAALQNSVRDGANVHALATSRFVQYLLDMLRHSFTYDFMRAPVVLHAISSYNDATLDQTAAAVTGGLTTCIQAGPPLRNDISASPDFWSILHRLHQHKTEADRVFDILSALTNSSPSGITTDNYESAIVLATSLATSASQTGSMHEQRRDLAARRNQKSRPPPKEDVALVQRALRAITLIFNASALAHPLIQQSHLDRNEAWAAYWSPVFRGLGVLSVSPCREIRHRALSALQRVLLSEDLIKDAESNGDLVGKNTEWPALFTEVLFPLTLRLLKPEVHQLDPVGMSETRVQLATLLCKVFLQYHEYLARWKPATTTSSSDTEAGRPADASEQDVGMHEMKSTSTASKKPENKLLEMWVKTLELLDRLSNASVGTKEGEALEEAVTEGVKNMLLVMADEGYLVKPPTDVQTSEKGRAYYDDKRRVWDDTRNRLRTFLPGLMDALFPDAPESRSEGQAVSASEKGDRAN